MGQMAPQKKNHMGAMQRNTNQPPPFRIRTRRRRLSCHIGGEYWQRFKSGPELRANMSVDVNQSYPGFSVRIRTACHIQIRACLHSFSNPCLFNLQHFSHYKMFSYFYKFSFQSQYERVIYSNPEEPKSDRYYILIPGRP